MTNLVTTTPTRFGVIQPALLPPMAVLETISTESIISNRMQQLVTIWNQHDPPNAATYDVGTLEFDPIKINQELNAYFELLVRDRVNQACRSVTLAYAVGADLDAIGSRYPYGLPRMTGEGDTAYRNRIWLSPNILSLTGPGQGTYESYVFWALSAPMPIGETSLKSVAALTTPGTGVVTLSIMSAKGQPATSAYVWKVSPDNTTWSLTTGTQPTPTTNQILAVSQYICNPGYARKGLTDALNVVPPQISNTTIDVDVTLFPGVDPVATMNAVAAAIGLLIQAIAWLGADLTRLALAGALAQPGVYNVNVKSPATDVIVAVNGCVNIVSATLRYIGNGE